MAGPGHARVVTVQKRRSPLACQGAEESGGQIPACRSSRAFEADPVPHRLGQAFKLAIMVGQNADDLTRLSFDACEPLGGFALVLDVTALELKLVTLALRELPDERAS